MKALCYLALGAVVAAVLLNYRSCSRFDSLFEDRSKGPYPGAPLPALLGHLHRETRRSDELDARFAAARRCHEAKDQVVTALLHGRLTLLQAAAAFRDLHRAFPDIPLDNFRAFTPGASDEETLCRSVIFWAAESLERQDASEGVRKTLEAELKSHLARGPLRLPGPRRIEPLTSPASED